MSSRPICFRPAFTADPALAVTDEELDRSRQRSLSFMHSEATHLAVGGSIHDYHRTPANVTGGVSQLPGLPQRQSRPAY